MRRQVGRREDPVTPLGEREDRDCKVKGAAASDLTLHPDPAALSRNQLFCYEQPEPQPFAARFRNGFYLRQAVEDRQAILHADSTSGIRHGQVQKTAVFSQSLYSDGYLAP